MHCDAVAVTRVRTCHWPAGPRRRRDAETISRWILEFCACPRTGRLSPPLEPASEKVFVVFVGHHKAVF